MKVCKVCGGTEFYSKPECKTCAKRRIAEYKRKNIEKISLYQLEYRKANVDSKKQNDMQRYAINRDVRIEKMRAYYAANKKRCNSSSSAWYQNNKDRSKLISAEWRKLNPENRNNAHYKRRNLKNIGGGLSVGLAQKLMVLQKCKCVVCKCSIKNKYHLDHIMPLALGGEHADSNIQLLCPTCNYKKHAKHPIDFMQEKGFLL